MTWARHSGREYFSDLTLLNDGPFVSIFEAINLLDCEIPSNMSSQILNLQMILVQLILVF